jgi:hypothetical protein
MPLQQRRKVKGIGRKAEPVGEKAIHKPYIFLCRMIYPLPSTLYLQPLRHDCCLVTYVPRALPLFFQP